jgi:hypothetical protein
VGGLAPQRQARPWRLLDDKTVHAHLVAFPGVSLFACAWAATYAVTSDTLGTAEKIIFGAAVLGDVALVGATTLSIIDVIQLRRRWTPTVRP